MQNPMDLTRKRVLITGASSGIGRACAELAAQLGASVILVARRQHVLEEVRLGLEKPERHQCIACDVGDVAAIKGLVTEIVAGGKLDGLVHAAGTMPLMPIGVVDQEVAKSAFCVNYFSFVELMKHCTKVGARNSGFSSVVVSSVSYKVGWPAGSVYCGTKGAVSATVRSLALELAPKRIRVNAVCPSNIRTPLHDVSDTVAPPDEFYQKLAAQQPLGLGEPNQVALAVCFLLSDAASFITGVNLPVDGGYLAR